MNNNNYDILYIEDEALNRENNIAILQKYGKVLPPTTGEECKSALDVDGFKVAIIDYKLTKWVGKNNEKPIKIDDREIANGIEIAEYLIEKNPEINIGLFSSFEDALRRDVRAAKLTENVEIIESEFEPEKSSSQLPNYLKKFNNFILSLENISTNETNYPFWVRRYFTNRLFHPIKLGAQILKTGPFGLKEVFSRQDIKNEKQFISAEEKFANRNSLSIKTKSIRSNIIEIKNNENNHLLSVNTIYEMIMSNNLSKISLNTALSPDLIAAEMLCEFYFEDSINYTDFALAAKLLPLNAQLECQKYMYRKILNKYMNEFHAKEQVYEMTNKFSDLGLPKILDIFLARIDKMEDKISYVKLTSLSPERVVRAEKFDNLHIQKYHLTEDSQFEYTIYEPCEGSIAFQIQPV